LPSHAGQHSRGHNQSTEAERIGRAWQFWLTAVGLTISPIAFFAGYLLSSNPLLHTWLGSVPSDIAAGQNVRYFVGEWLLFSAFIGALTSWPFFVMGRAAKRGVIDMWLNVRSARPALIGGLIGLSTFHGLVHFMLGYIVEEQQEDPYGYTEVAYVSMLLSLFGFAWNCPITVQHPVTSKLQAFQCLMAQVGRTCVNQLSHPPVSPKQHICAHGCPMPQHHPV
jgi:hypothetical protein